METTHVILECDGEAVPLNAFVQKIFAQTILGMVRSLDKIKENPRQIHLTIAKEVK